MDGFSRILDKKLSELLCTQLYTTFKLHGIMLWQFDRSGKLRRLQRFGRCKRSRRYRMLRMTRRFGIFGSYKTSIMSYTTGTHKRSMTISHGPSELEFKWRFNWCRSFRRSESPECHKMPRRSRRSGKPKS